MANLGFIPQAGGAAVVVGTAFLAAALGLLGAQVFAFEAIVTAVAAFLSTDGIVEAANRRALSTALASAAALAGAAGALALALSIPAFRAVIEKMATWDSLRRLGLDVPNPHLAQASSISLGALVIGMHLVGSRLGGPLGPLFMKEGPFELVTAVLEVVAVVWCVAAAAQWYKHRRAHMPRGVPALYGALAVVLFLVAMEELNWGQTLLEFDTPPAWAALNYQQQTSLHNLVHPETLETAQRALIMLFGVGVLASVALAVKWPHSVFAAIAPPASLGGLAALCAIPGAYLRLEVTELLLAIFFAFYSYRIHVAARDASRHRRTDAPLRSARG